jgi:methyl-accepting chemotaxis protein
MTSRTTEVSTEAEETGRRASAVLDNTEALGSAVREMTQAVVRAVRTSTVEVDRRATARQTMDLPCRLTVGGQTHEARVADLSEGGAHLRGAPALQSGARGTLHIDRVGFPLPFVVRLHENGALRVAFELDDRAAAAFRGMPDRLAQRRAA